MAKDGSVISQSQEYTPRDPKLLGLLITQRLAYLATPSKITITITNKSINNTQTYKEYDPSTRLAVVFSEYFKEFPHTSENNYLRFDIIVPSTDATYKRVVLPLETSWDCDVRLSDIGILDSDKFLIQNVEIVAEDEFQDEFPNGEVIDDQDGNAYPFEPFEVERTDMMDLDEPESDEDIDESVVVKQEPLQSDNPEDIPPDDADDGITMDDPIVLKDESQECASTPVEMPPGNQEQKKTITWKPTNDTQTPPEDKTSAKVKTATTTTTEEETKETSPFKKPDSVSTTNPINATNLTRLPESLSCAIKIKPEAPFKSHSFRLRQDVQFRKLIELFRRKLTDGDDLSKYEISLFDGDRELDSTETPMSIGFKSSVPVVLKARIVVRVLFKIIPVGFDGPTLNYRVSRTKALSKTFKRYQKTLGKSNLQFFYKNDMVNPQLTAEQIGIQSGDALEAKLV